MKKLISTMALAALLIGGTVNAQEKPAAKKETAKTEKKEAKKEAKTEKKEAKAEKKEVKKAEAKK
jgi:Ni/Co efflux regulator RcnB